MDSQRCASCSEPTQPRSCQCHRMPTNLKIVQKVLNKHNKTRKCIRKCAQSRVEAAAATAAATGDNIDCLCDRDVALSRYSDHRLKRWERELQLRNSIAERLMQRTGKSACELLFNRPVTVDVRDKLMMQRLLAHAQSRKPHAVQTKAVIKEQLPNGCFIEELTSAKPARKKYFEISGLPAGVKCELIGENCCIRRSGWIASRTVREQIAANSKNIKRVVPFFPDIEYLQVIGKKMTINCMEEEDCKGHDDENDCCSAPPNVICSEYAACLADDQDMEEEDSLSMCGTKMPIYNRKNYDDVNNDCRCSQPPDSFDDSNDKANYEIFCCFRDQINQSGEKDSLNATTATCSSNDFDYYNELISNRAKCHNVFFDL